MLFANANLKIKKRKPEPVVVIVDDEKLLPIPFFKSSPKQIEMKRSYPINKMEVYDYMHPLMKEIAMTLDRKQIADKFIELSKDVVPITYDENLYEEIKEYFVMDIDAKRYHPYVYDLLGPVSRNLVPDIIRIRRKIKRNFKLKLVDAGLSSNSPLINYIFMSIDEDGEYDGKVTFRRTDESGYQIIIN